MSIRKKALKPGDILMFRTIKSSLPGSWLISWFQNIVGKSPISGVSYSHVGIVDWDTDYILDSRWPKSKRRKIKWKSWGKYYGLELWRVRKVQKDEIKKALDPECYSRLSKKNWENEEYRKKYEKKYVVIFPDGSEKVIRGINRFCREYGLSSGTLGMVVRGKRKSHKGYKARYYKE